MQRGIIYAILAYGMWGLLPVYWKQLQTVPALEILGHRMVWSLLFILAILLIRNHWQWLGRTLRSPRMAVAITAAATLLGLNWYIYIWAVNSGNILDASLGYFINPLITVGLGVVILGERPRPWQWGSIGIALVGVLFLTFKYGAFPWVSITLAVTFGLYGLIKKTATLDSLEGVSLESALMFLPALGYLGYLTWTGQGAFGSAGLKTNILLASTGAITAIPLIFFAGAARRIPMTTLGLLHFIVPTLQFLVGTFIYGESVGSSRLAGFIFVWVGLVIFSIDSLFNANGGKGGARPAASAETH
ncbi:MAG: EamA family transporter RarD [Candidatus Neomarinimicrobiota bacterium]